MPHSLELTFSFPEHLLDGLRQILIREGEVDPTPLHGEQQLLLPPIAAGFAPGFDRALGQRLAVVGNDEVGIVPQNIAEPFALRAGAERMVERKEDRANRFKRSAASLAAKVRAVGAGALVDDLHAALALALTKGRFNRFDEAGSIVFTDDQPIEDHIQMVRPACGKSLDLVEIQDLRAALQSAVPAQQERLEKGLLLFRRRGCDGKQNHRACVAAMGQKVVGDAAGVKTARLDGAIGADRMANFGEQESQKVGDFSRGADRRAGGANGVLLFDGNGGADVDQPVDIGPIDLVEKHAGIGGERFHLAPLAFGEQGVERERGFPRS